MDNIAEDDRDWSDSVLKEGIARLQDGNKTTRGTTEEDGGSWPFAFWGPLLVRAWQVGTWMCLSDESAVGQLHTYLG